MNPDAIFAQPTGAPPVIAPTALTRMNAPGQAPQRERCAEALQQLQEFAASVPAKYNDHNVGHLGLVVSAAEYSSKTNGQAHVPPPNPGSLPVVPAGASAAVRDEVFRQYYLQRGHYDLYKAVETAAKKLVVEAIDASYIDHLKDDMVGFAQVSVRALIDTITDRYLKFNEKQKEALEDKLEEQYSGGPIDPHIAIFNSVYKSFASAGEPFTEKQKISKFYRTVRKFTLAKKACEEWDAKPAADKTWANIQKHFREWYDLKMADTTTEGAGYHGANLASTDAVPSRTDLLLADTTEALKTNQAMMANLAKKNDEKDTTIAKLRQEIASLKAENRVLREGRTQGGRSGGHRGGGQHLNGTGHFQGQGPNLGWREKNELKSILPSGHYCHTCGYSADHCSRDCPCPGPNHEAHATKYNPCGGSSRRN